VKDDPVAGDVLLQHMFENGDAISVTCLLPTKDLRAQGIAKLTASRLSLINRVSVVLIVTFCRPGKKDLRALFTADADGKKIVSELQEQQISPTFDYVDMPHHGSGENHPKEFLCGFSTEKESVPGVDTPIIVISTNGSKHGHPDKNTLQELDKYLAAKPNRTLWFNYDEHIPNKKKKARKKRKRERQPHTYFPATSRQLRFPQEGQNFLQISLEFT